MSVIENEVWEETVYDKYWGRFLADCETTKTHPDTSSFLVWLDENQLIPDMDDQDD